jgi:hypothetical protein
MNILLDELKKLLLCCQKINVNIWIKQDRRKTRTSWARIMGFAPTIQERIARMFENVVYSNHG